MVDFKSSRLESDNEVSQRLLVLLSDGKKAIWLVWHSSTSAKMGQEPFLQLNKGIDATWFQTGVLGLGSSLQNGGKGDAEKGVSGTLNPHA